MTQIKKRKDYAGAQELTTKERAQLTRVYGDVDLTNRTTQPCKARACQRRKARRHA
jgi:hypothetical protein